MRAKEISFSNKGFTITEIVLILGVVGIMLSGILPLFLNIITVNKSARYYSTAYKLVDSRIEELRDSPFDTVVSATETITALPQGQFVVTSTNTIDGAPQADIKKVNVKIRWYFKKQNQIEIETYLARKGIK